MQHRGRGAVIRYALSDGPLGRMLVARTAEGLCAVALDDEDQVLLEELRTRYPEAEIAVSPDGLCAEAEQVLRHLEPEPDVPFPDVDVAGTPFEQRVWAAMRRIPRGTVTEYGLFARSLGLPKASRAVGAAIGKNPLAILYPCHRLVAQGGTLHRYRWGLERKRQLLAMERLGSGDPGSHGSTGTTDDQLWLGF